MTIRRSRSEPFAARDHSADWAAGAQNVGKSIHHSVIIATVSQCTRAAGLALAPALLSSTKAMSATTNKSVADAVREVHAVIAKHGAKTDGASVEAKAWILSKFLALRKEFFPCVAAAKEAANGPISF